MAGTRRILLDRYEQGLLVRALYEARKRMQTEGARTDAVEDLLLKVIDAPDAGWWTRITSL